MFSADDIRMTYQKLHDNVQTRNLIRSYSCNRRDIREVALEGLDLSKTETVLDLGCGDGFFIRKLNGLLADNADVVGIDIIDAGNTRTFLDMVDSMGYRGTFYQTSAGAIRDIEDVHFDLIIASYSLYFFPYLIREIARILKPAGVFIALTHTRFSLQEITRFIPQCLQMIGIEPPREIKINKLFNRFSLENGRDKIEPYFSGVERIIYSNNLVFPEEQINDCLEYLRYKRSLLFKELLESEPAKYDRMLALFHQKILARAMSDGKLQLTKNDAIFRCSQPRP